MGIMTAVRYNKYKDTHDRNQAVNDYYRERNESGKRLRELAIQILNSIG